MEMIEPRCPGRVAVIGGGRWVRVLTEVLCELTPPSVELSVHSQHNAPSMMEWAAVRGLGQRIRVSSVWPDATDPRSTAVIVANAARDHENAVKWALSARMPVLVEKPIAVTAAAAKRLADMARTLDVRFGAAHVFLFARYLERFSKAVALAGQIRSVRVAWEDPSSEDRYGERKHFDPGLPVFADCLPHVVSVVSALGLDDCTRCENIRVLRGGAHFQFELLCGRVWCSITLIRNGSSRRRTVEVAAGRETLQLDFSKEPGTITRGSETTVGDPDWTVKSHPVGRMLASFLHWAAGGERDERLDIELGLHACRITDQATVGYRYELLPWLISRLTSQSDLDVDLRYALGEMLQDEGPLSTSVLEKKIAAVQDNLSGIDGARRLAELGVSRDPAQYIRSLAA